MKYRIGARTAVSWAKLDNVGNAATYPILLIDADETLHVFYRERESKNRIFLCYQRKRLGEHWTTPTPLAITTRGGTHYRNYFQSALIDRSGRLHLAFSFWAHGVSTRAAYLTSVDGGTTWHNVRLGVPLALPCTRESRCKISGPDNLFPRTVGVGVDLEGQPVVCVETPHADAAGYVDYSLHQLKDGQWHKTPVDLPHGLQMHDSQKRNESDEVYGSEGTFVATSSGNYIIAGVASRGGRRHLVAIVVRNRQSKVFNLYVDANDVWKPWDASIERPSDQNPVKDPWILFSLAREATDQPRKVFAVQFIESQLDQLVEIEPL